MRPQPCADGFGDGYRGDALRRTPWAQALRVTGKLKPVPEKGGDVAMREARLFVEQGRLPSQDVDSRDG